MVWLSAVMLPEVYVYPASVMGKPLTGGAEGLSVWVTGIIGKKKIYMHVYQSINQSIYLCSTDIVIYK